MWFSKTSMCQSSFTGFMTMHKARELAVKKNDHREIKQNMSLCSRTILGSSTGPTEVILVSASVLVPASVLILTPVLIACFG